jgi:hemoglobin
MAETKHDILTRSDITLFINEFYAKVRKDELLSIHFSQVNWEHHTPIIIDFWCMLLLGDQSYKGNPIAKHLRMPLTKDDFARWLFHFINAIDNNFAGERANEAKQRAQNIASMFQFKMGLMVNP